MRSVEETCSVDEIKYLGSSLNGEADATDNAILPLDNGPAP